MVVKNPSRFPQVAEHFAHFFHNHIFKLTQKPVDGKRILPQSCKQVKANPEKSAQSCDDLIAYIDGGSRGNPGPSGIGVVIEGARSGKITIGRWIGEQDNNVAEYVALLEALQCAARLKAKKLHIYSDSEVVVRQMRGEYRCRSPRLYSLHWICRKLARGFDFSISHVEREANAEANRLAAAALRQEISRHQISRRQVVTA